MFLSFFIYLLIQFSGAVLVQEQPLTFVNLSAASLTQCATVPIKWNGGVSPFSIFVATVDTPDSTFSSAEDSMNIDASPSDWTIDFPSGTSFTIMVQDNTGSTAQSGILTVLPSTNTSCLDDSTADPPPTGHDHGNDPPNPQTLQSQSVIQTSNPSATPTDPGIQSSSGLSQNSHTAVIAGTISAIVVVVAAIVIFLIIYTKRRQRKKNLFTSRENVIRTFGNHTAGFDGDEDPTTIADPFVYRPTVKAFEVSLTDGGGSEPRFSTGGVSLPSRSSLPGQPAQAARLKGEIYLPTITITPPDDTPSASGMKEDDIERLAARMVAMMSAGRMSEQAWSPKNKKTANDDDGLPAYEDRLRDPIEQV